MTLRTPSLARRSFLSGGSAWSDPWKGRPLRAKRRSRGASVGGVRSPHRRARKWRSPFAGKRETRAGSPIEKWIRQVLRQGPAPFAPCCDQQRGLAKALASVASPLHFDISISQASTFGGGGSCKSTRFLPVENAVTARAMPSAGCRTWRRRDCVAECPAPRAGASIVRRSSGRVACCWRIGARFRRAYPACKDLWLDDRAPAHRHLFRVDQRFVSIGFKSGHGPEGFALGAPKGGLPRRAWFATMADIRRRAKASTGSIYHQFGSKEHLAAEVSWRATARRDGSQSSSVRPTRAKGFVP